MWDLPGPGIEPVHPALAGGFCTTEPPVVAAQVIFFYILKPVISPPAAQALVLPEHRNSQHTRLKTEMTTQLTAAWGPTMRCGQGDATKCCEKKQKTISNWAGLEKLKFLKRNEMHMQKT